MSKLADWLSNAAFRRWLGQASEPHILFPAIAVLVLTAIWASTLSLIHLTREAAEQAAAGLSEELAGTYEAQVVRALRETDQTLRIVKYEYERKPSPAVLEELKQRGLLPPEFVFVVGIAGANGEIVASTRASANARIADQRDDQSQLGMDGLWVGRARPIPDTSEWSLQFSRRINAPDGSYAGTVTVSVDAAYFVSGYEAAKLGRHGVLAILGTDGEFRVRRTGEVVSAGDRVDYAAVVPATYDGISAARLATNPWDGVLRYTSVTPLYEFPLAVLVGLSADEQLASAREDIRTYLWRALAGSVLVVLFIAVLGRTSWQLAVSRQLAVDEQIAHAARIEYLAYHDGLTTLPNRSLFSKLLSQSISQARRYDRQLAVLFLDLDRFKNINDSLGHDAGDLLLQEVAGRLKSCLRDSDTVARLGGDEFVALLPELDEEKYVASVAQKILSTIARPFVLAGQEFRISASIGISTYPQDGLDEQTLTKRADVAMYQAKAAGKNNFQFYSEQLNASSLERLNLEAGLRRALERGEFQLHYQAKRAIGNGRITGMEALLRWQHPDLGTVAPLQFIPIAEDTGLIVPIGKWVLRTACMQNVAWQRQGLARLSMSVNIAARQFADDQLLADVTAILADTGMDANLLELEINESLLMRDVETAMRILGGLKAIGIRIAIDDFGIGYASLGTLKQFPLDTIKIDRSFIRDVTSMKAGKDLTEAIITMGRTLSLTVVAQGVETKEQADYLRRNACDEFQGFYLDRPLPADQLAALLQRQMGDAPDAVAATT